MLIGKVFLNSCYIFLGHKHSTSIPLERRSQSRRIGQSFSPENYSVGQLLYLYPHPGKEDGTLSSIIMHIDLRDGIPSNPHWEDPFSKKGTCWSSRDRMQEVRRRRKSIMSQTLQLATLSFPSENFFLAASGDIVPFV